MKTEELIIDCDGHILEPPDLWEKYIDPKYRERAMRIRVGDDGFEYLEIDGKRAKMTAPGLLGSLGGMGKKVEDARKLRESAMRGDAKPEQVRMLAPKPENTYLKGAAFGTMVMKERLELLNKEGMAKSILYPTIGLLWEAELFDAELSAAYCRAYNRWIADFCRDSGGRLIPIAHLSLGDPAEAARELERAVKDGCKGAFVCPFTITRVPHGDPRHDAVFAAAQDLGVPLAIHPTFEPASFGIHHRYDNFALGRVVLRSVRGPGRSARIRHALPVGRVRPVSKIARGSARVTGGMDRLLPRSRRRHLQRHHARRDGTPEGEAVVLLQAPVLHLGRSRRTYDCGDDADCRRG